MTDWLGKGKTNDKVHYKNGVKNSTAYGDTQPSGLRSTFSFLNFSLAKNLLLIYSVLCTTFIKFIQTPRLLNNKVLENVKACVPNSATAKVRNHLVFLFSTINELEENNFISKNL